MSTGRFHLRSWIFPVLFLGINTACGGGSGGGGQPAIKSAQTYNRSYDLSDGGCRAIQSVTAPTAKEADQKICLAVQDDALNNFCAPRSREAFAEVFCGVTRPLPLPAPKPGNRPLDPTEREKLDRQLEQVAVINISVLAEEARTLAQLIAACGLTTKGPACLDSPQFIRPGQVYRNGTVSVEFYSAPESAEFKMDFINENQVALWMGSRLAATLRLGTDRNLDSEAGLSRPFLSARELYHVALRSLARHRSSETMAGSFKAMIERNALLIAREPSFVYQEAIVNQGLENAGLSAEDFASLASKFSGLPADRLSLAAKVLVLNHAPERVAYKPAALELLEDSRWALRKLALTALGKQEVLASDLEAIAAETRGYEPVAREAWRVLRSLKLTEDHIPALRKQSPRLACELLAKIKTESSVREIAGFFKSSDPKVRIFAVRALQAMEMDFVSAFKALRAQEKLETDPDVKAALREGI